MAHRAIARRSWHYFRTKNTAPACICIASRLQLDNNSAWLMQCLSADDSTVFAEQFVSRYSCYRLLIDQDSRLASISGVASFRGQVVALLERAEWLSCIDDHIVANPEAALFLQMNGKHREWGWSMRSPLTDHNCKPIIEFTTIVKSIVNDILVSESGRDEPRPL